MSAELLGQLVDLTRAAELAHVGAAITVWCWITRGIGGVRLHAVRRGRAWRTTPGWIVAFFEALAARGVQRRARKPRP